MGRTRVRDIMPEKMVTISAEDTLSTVEDIMTLGSVRHMPVVRGGKLVGVVSERDLLRASLSRLSEFGDDHVIGGIVATASLVSRKADPHTNPRKIRRA